MPHESSDDELEQIIEGLSKQLSLESVGNIDISQLHEGVHLENPITQKNVTDMIDSFKRKIILHESYVTQILTTTTLHI